MNDKNKLSQWARIIGTRLAILLCTGVLFAGTCLQQQIEQATLELAESTVKSIEEFPENGNIDMLILLVKSAQTQLKDRLLQKATTQSLQARIDKAVKKWVEKYKAAKTVNGKDLTQDDKVKELVELLSDKEIKEGLLKGIDKEGAAS